MTKGIGRRALSGISWTLFGAFVSNMLRVAVLALISRLLTKHDIGITTSALVVVMFATRFRELGIGLALIQRKEIDHKHITTTYGFTMAMGAVLAVIVFGCAAPLARLFKASDGVAIIQLLSVMFLLRGVTAGSQFLLHRELKFRELAMIDVVSYSVGSLISIALAFRGWGPWSLAVGYVFEAATECVLTIWIRRPPGVPKIHWSALRQLLAFGGGQTLASFGNYFANQGDYLVVGNRLGPSALGVYSRAYELMRFPAALFTSVAGSVLFSVFARLQDDPKRLGDMYRRVLFAIAIVLMPASAGLIVLAPEAIRILLGPNWGGAVLPFQIMAVSMVFRTSYKASGLVARSASAVYRVAAWQAAYAVFVVLGAAVAVKWGIVGVSITTGAAVIFHFVALTRLALRQVSIGWRSVITAHIDGLISAALVIVLALPVAVFLRNIASPAVVTIAGTTVAGLLLPIGFVMVRVRARHPDWVWLRERMQQAIKRKVTPAALSTG
ncbi:MAG: lipopolysaccharide biosynthesis protein [Kofleriaceae bacterium]